MLYRSEDAVHWAKVYEAGNQCPFEAVTTAFGVFVAVGTKETHTSADGGLSWTSIPQP